MAEEILAVLKRKYGFLSIILESIGQAVRELEKNDDPEEIYRTMTVFLGEFPTKKILQDIADEKGLGIRVRTTEDALTVIRSLKER
ncbi:hypothetical protein E3E36_06585 [Thermococcus sp. M36]|uniref:hypothetical protein n=1 Tax=Thermococcus sp. M36 TaxID=1638261 RepID=UPI00143B0EC8|nr:hypothetical protein [Thermococcus sp. M36]NJE05814.1 hypothetical protein [Thermococcus sp. M36]